MIIGDLRCHAIYESRKGRTDARWIPKSIITSSGLRIKKLKYALALEFYGDRLRSWAGASGRGYQTAYFMGDASVCTGGPGSQCGRVSGFKNGMISGKTTLKLCMVES